MTDTKRRGQGAGTIEKVGDRYRFKCPDGSGGRYVSPLAYDSSEAAVRGCAVYRKALLAGELVPVGGLTLAQYVKDSWLPRRERSQPKSARTYKSVWDSQVSKAPFAHRPLRAIKRRDVRAWMDRLEISPRGPLALVKVILNDAVDDELIDFSPAAGIRLPRFERDDTSPTREEQQAFAACEAIPFVAKAIAGVASSCALRPMEWRRLTVAECHLDAAPPYLAINKSKRGKSRKVPILGDGLTLLRAWLAALPEYAPRNARGLVFPQPNGKLRRASHPLGTIDGADAWKVYLARAGITKPVRLHDLRHAGANDLLFGRREGGAWTLPEVSRYLGHGSPTTTAKFYLHSTDEVVFNAAERSARAVLSSPATDPKTAEIKGRESISQGSPSSSRNGDSAPDEAVNAGIASGRTADVSSGLVAELREAIGRQRAGKLTTAERVALLDRVLAERRSADPIERLAARIAGPHSAVAFAELVTTIVPDLPRRRSPRKGASK
jgi:integrase